MSKKNRVLAKLVVLSALLSTVFQANAVIIDYVPGVADYDTHGDNMGGMSVTAYFGSSSEEVFWVDDHSTDSGSASGTGWNLSLTGDTYWENWVLTTTRLSSPLTSLVLNGIGGYVMFDINTGNEGTPGSELGWGFVDVSGLAVSHSYSREIGIDPTGPWLDGGGADMVAPVGDLWHVLAIDFGNGLAGGTTYEFQQDTDNDNRRTIPEPTGIALMGLGLFVLGFMRRPCC